MYSLIVLCVYFSTSLYSQNQTTNAGKNFWVGFMENQLPPLISLHFAAENNANITVAIPVLGNVGFFLGAKKDTIIVIPTAQAYITGSENTQNRGVFISSDTAISVIALNNAANSSDAISLIPLEYLPKGGRYIINTFRGLNSSPSEFLIVAPEDNTQVEIIPSSTTRNGRPSGVPFTVMLQRGQTYQVQAADTSSMGGSRIRVSNGCKKLVVFSGAKCSQVNYNAGCTGCDHLWVQEVPTSYWGTNYHSVHINQMDSAYVLSFVASENNTVVSIDGIPTLILNAGQQRVVNYMSNNVRCIEADKPISVMQLIKSGGCNGYPNPSPDPSMFRLIAQGQEIRKTYFSVLKTSNISSSFISVICTNPSNVFLNGVALPSVFGVSVVDVCVTKKAVTIPFLSQYNSLESEELFTAYMYGFGKDESYFLSMGSAYENTELNFTFNPSDFVYCNTNQTFDFTAITQKYSNLKWSFGDGNTSSGENVNHTFNNSGRFEVMLIGTKADSDCLEDTVRKFITLFEPPFLDLGGDTIVCKQPDLLIAPNTNPSYDYVWQNGSTAKNFLVSQDQVVYLTVTDENGCQKTDSISVIFDECLEKKVIIPNVFTPGKDGLNDALFITLEVYDQAECIVYNRWGIELYRYNPKRDLPWNGSVANDLSKPCPDGTYYIILNFRDPDTNQYFIETGVITLIREQP